jgi:hypothetical protein
MYSVSVWSAVKTTLTSSQIQNAMVQYFPLREYAAFARITINVPDVLLTKGAKEVVLIMPVDANIPDLPLQQGHARIGIFINYNPSDGGIYFSDPRIIEFEMPSVSKKIYKDLYSTVDNILKNALPLIQFYKVNESDLNHSLNKSVLKYFSIEDGKLSVEVGFE